VLQEVVVVPKRMYYHSMSVRLRTTNRTDWDFNPELPETEVWTTSRR